MLNVNETIFAEQVYVAMSRASSLEKLHILDFDHSQKVNAETCFCPDLPHEIVLLWNNQRSSIIRWMKSFLYLEKSIKKKIKKMSVLVKDNTSKTTIYVGKLKKKTNI